MDQHAPQPQEKLIVVLHVCPSSQGIPLTGTETMEALTVRALHLAAAFAAYGQDPVARMGPLVDHATTLFSQLAIFTYTAQQAEVAPDVPVWACPVHGAPEADPE